MDPSPAQDRTYTYTVTETATEIRKALRALFPGVRFSVRSRTYSGGARVDVCWTDGPSQASVESVTAPFAAATLVGYPDNVARHTSIYHGRRVRWGADFVECHRAYSRPLVDRAVAVVRERYNLPEPAMRDDWPTDDWQHIPVEGFGDAGEALRHTLYYMPLSAPPVGQ